LGFFLIDIGVFSIGLGVLRSMSRLTSCRLGGDGNK